MYKGLSLLDVEITNKSFPILLLPTTSSSPHLDGLIDSA